MVGMYQEAKPSQPASMYRSICKFWLELAANPMLKVSTHLRIHFILISFVCELILTLQDLSFGKLIFLGPERANVMHIKTNRYLHRTDVLFQLFFCLKTEAICCSKMSAGLQCYSPVDKVLLLFDFPLNK
jgi:hypothetical protein